MEPVAIAVLAGISVYLFIIALVPRRFLKQTSGYTRSMLEKIESGTLDMPPEEEEFSVLREQAGDAGGFARIFMTMPGANKVYDGLLKAGMGDKVGQFLLYCFSVFVLAVYALRNAGGAAIPVGGIAAFLFGYWYIKRSIAKRNYAFLDFFPEALEMIVRSVRSGYPLNASIRAVADNTQPPVSTEFKKMADEIAYGSTLIEALRRLAKRIDEPDVHFFVVVLSVQQDVGGNLSEVLGNLASLIRKRKHLRMKIKAMTSEGRATGWVLGSMPFAAALFINLADPNYLTPLFETQMGHVLLIGTLIVVSLGILLVKLIINIRI